jgi:hypothetical protein
MQATEYPTVTRAGLLSERWVDICARFKSAGVLVESLNQQWRRRLIEHLLAGKCVAR